MALPEPVTRKEQYLYAIATNGGGGGGSSVTVEPLEVTENGTYTAPDGKAYSPVSVGVANTYISADAGKVVKKQGGGGPYVQYMLSEQTATTKTGVGAYDTTYNNSVTFRLAELTNAAESNDIASGKTAYGADGTVITGTASGGGNPNYVEAIEGTFRNPWGGYNPVALLGDMRSGHLTLFLSYEEDDTGRVLTLGWVPARDDRKVSFAYFTQVTTAMIGSSEIVTYDEDGQFLHYGDYTHPSEYNEYADDPCTLTIIHHPLPDDTP